MDITESQDDKKLYHQKAVYRWREKNRQKYNEYQLQLYYKRRPPAPTSVEGEIKKRGRGRPRKENCNMKCIVCTHVT